MQRLKIYAALDKLKVSCNPLPFLCSVSAVIALCLNIQALQTVFIQDNSPGIDSTLFNFSTVILIFALILISTIPFVLFNIPKLGAFLFLFLSASATYFSAKYGVMIDETVTRSFFETSYGEAYQYLNFNLVIWNILVTALLASAFFFIRVRPEAILSRLLTSLKLFGIAISIVLLIGLSFYKDYASFLRNNRQIRHMVNPISPIYEVGRYWKVRLFPQTHEFTPIGTDAHHSHGKIKRKKLVIFVLGETARADHFSINGYESHITNPSLSAEDLVSFSNVQSCGTATAVSVPCIFSDLGRDNFDSENHEFRGNLLDVIAKAGYGVKWIDNNTGCQGVCKRIESIDLTKYQNSEVCKSGTCFDEILVNAIRDLPKTNKDEFIVLHTLGSHGPSYYLRYPEKFNTFNPSCSTSDLSKCSKEEVINTYDNTILYTDYVLGELISYLKSLKDTTDTALIYVSDHGESLGENGLYLHSLPYVLAPKEQKTVPMIFWFSEMWKKENEITAFYQTKLNVCQFSHDNVFSTVLNILDIDSAEYNPELDLLKIDALFCQAKFKRK